MLIPRFHPMVTNFGNGDGWYVVDCCNTDHRGVIQGPVQEDPYETRAEALAVCAKLNETEPDPREK